MTKKLYSPVAVQAITAPKELDLPGETEAKRGRERSCPMEEYPGSSRHGLRGKYVLEKFSPTENSQRGGGVLVNELLKSTKFWEWGETDKRMKTTICLARGEKQVNRRKKREKKSYRERSMNVVEGGKTRGTDSSH